MPSVQLPEKVSVYEGQYLDLLARTAKRDGTAVVDTDFDTGDNASWTFRVHDKQSGSTIYTANDTSFDGSDGVQVHATLQTDGAWTKDDTGYNVECSLWRPANFTTEEQGGKKYIAELILTSDDTADEGAIPHVWEVSVLSLSST